jgi:hypothetical protein
MLTELEKSGYCSFEWQRECRLQMLYPTCMDDTP